MESPEMTRKTGTTTADAEELAWSHAVQDIPQTGLSEVREATPEERARVTGALDLIACASLQAQYTIAPTAGGCYRLFGRLRADVSQTCVVSLEPVDSTIEEPFEAVFWPQDRMPEPEKGELAIDAEPEREAIVDGHIAVGRVVFESLAAALDPFPRKPGAVLEQQHAPAANAAGDKAANPFAVLANLKPKG
jgi:Large ribosomal RNA subunit accumulation protein YceD